MSIGQGEMIRQGQFRGRCREHRGKRTSTAWDAPFWCHAQAEVTIVVRVGNRGPETQGLFGAADGSANQKRRIAATTGLDDQAGAFRPAAV